AKFVVTLNTLKRLLFIQGEPFLAIVIYDSSGVSITTSTRRFFCCPSSSSLDAIGLVSPYPFVLAFTLSYAHSFSRYYSHVFAIFIDYFQLSYLSIRLY